MTHPAVAEASVVAVPHGTSGKRPMAVVVVRASEHVTFDELRDLLAGKVPAWQIPDWWALIPERPKTSAGTANEKVQRRWYTDSWRGLDAPKMYR